MYKEEVVIKILSKTIIEFPDIEQLTLRNIIEEVLYNYEIQPACTALVPTNDMHEKIALYLACKKLDGLSMNTLHGYGRQLLRLATFLNKNTVDITAMDIRMYLAHVTKHKNLKNTTLETIKSQIKSFFSWLETEDYINKSPARKIKPTKTEKLLVEALTIEELEMLREGCTALRERALVEVMYATGCRLSEIVQMDKGDIDYVNCCAKVYGKGKKERIVYFSSKAMYHLKKYLLSRTDDDEALFTTIRQPYRRLKSRAIQKEISKIAERTEITKNVHPHVLRHTLATLMLNNGADITSVQDILGHKDPATTQRYASLTEENKKQTYKKHLVQ
ncbi:tyrosine recombinase XerC [Oxobacter pfennigii]|uniref:Tyrosine recombinase XerC n=1 Tax=Oxobacter pfennigii TaxID=36849 RepID=A0A0P9AAU8_9CLOT|nr:site-specific tyrosine recombinase/integron integrase [Oxobacter pfennigii]KPU42145.1 tyrosine recombinase XerC [Oxobacter pfennigii]